MVKLPKVLATSVIRASDKGESHGGLYLIDLYSEKFAKIIDWNKMDINWEGRGMDRGMRGITCYKDKIYTAISDEILVYDLSFKKVDSIRNKYLKHCHEIYIHNNKLYLTSTGFDSILKYDIDKRSFTMGYCLRFTLIKKILNRINIKYEFDSKILKLLPKLYLFNPNNDNGPLSYDSIHINNVHAENEKIFVSGRWMGNLLQIENNKVTSYATIPYLTHNARPYKKGVIANHTKKDKIVYLDRNNHQVEYYAVPRYDENSLISYDVPDHIARPGFGRGLYCYNDLILGGSSPATISVYRQGNSNPIKSVNLTMNIRNAIHGVTVLDRKVTEEKMI